MNFYIHAGGGVGDMIKHYFWGHHGWQYIESLKKKLPESKIKLFITCCNPAGTEIFKYHPLISEQKVLPWVNPNLPWKDKDKETKGYTNLNQVPDYIKDIEVKKPGIMYLSEEDKIQIDKYKPKGNYVVIHPFSGEKNRMVMSTESYVNVAKKIVKEFNCKVVILGGTSTRTIGTRCLTLNEDFPYEDKNIINLVNKTTIRTGVRITAGARYFLGTNSCFYCVRLGMGTPAVAYLNIHQTMKNPALYYKNVDQYWLATKGSATEDEAIERTINHIRKVLNNAK